MHARSDLTGEEVERYQKEGKRLKINLTHERKGIKMEALTENERYVLSRWSMFGVEDYPIEKKGRSWFIGGIRGCGVFPVAYKTKKEATTQWEKYIDALIAKGAGRAKS